MKVHHNIGSLPSFRNAVVTIGTFDGVHLGHQAVLAELKRLDEDMNVVMVTSQSSMATVSEAVRLGASGYILKHSPKEETTRALREILEGDQEESE